MHKPNNLAWLKYDNELGIPLEVIAGWLAEHFTYANRQEWYHGVRDAWIKKYWEEFEHKYG